MSICENCKTLDICTVVDGNKEACFFFNPTEKYRIEQSKEYAIGYKQGRKDVFDNIRENTDPNNIAMICYEQGRADYKASDEYAKAINEAFDSGVGVGKRDLMNEAIEKDIRADERAKVIDEFVAKCEAKIQEQNIDMEDECPFLDMIDIWKIAEQLKEQSNQIGVK